MVQIHSLGLFGFKSFIDQEISLSPLTVLTGLNSSGKSSVIQAIRMLKATEDLAKVRPIDGYGSNDELQNLYTKEPFRIHCAFSDLSGSVATSEYFSDSGINQITGHFPEIIYVSANRFGPATSLPIYDDFTLGSRGENVLNCIDHFGSQVLPPYLQHSNSEGETFEYNLSAWLGCISPGVRFKSYIHPQMDSSYALYDGHRSSNVGFGLSYALPLIVALFIGSIKSDCVVLLENPEAHLHPKGQTEMARLICSAVHAGCQVIVETHSDHLFDGIRIYAKRNTGFANKVTVHWFDMDMNKVTRVQSPIMDDYGNMDFWPEGLFDQFGLNASELLS